MNRAAKRIKFFTFETSLNEERTNEHTTACEDASPLTPRPRSPVIRLRPPVTPRPRSWATQKKRKALFIDTTLSKGDTLRTTSYQKTSSLGQLACLLSGIIANLKRCSVWSSLQPFSRHSTQPKETNIAACLMTHMMLIMFSICVMLFVYDQEVKSFHTHQGFAGFRFFNRYFLLHVTLWTIAFLQFLFSKHRLQELKDFMDACESLYYSSPVFDRAAVT